MGNTLSSFLFCQVNASKTRLKWKFLSSRDHLRKIKSSILRHTTTRTHCNQSARAQHEFARAHNKNNYNLRVPDSLAQCPAFCQCNKIYTPGRFNATHGTHEERERKKRIRDEIKYLWMIFGVWLRRFWAKAHSLTHTRIYAQRTQRRMSQPRTAQIRASTATWL